MICSLSYTYRDKSNKVMICYLDPNQALLKEDNFSVVQVSFVVILSLSADHQIFHTAFYRQQVDTSTYSLVGNNLQQDHLGNSSSSKMIDFHRTEADLA